MLDEYLSLRNRLSNAQEKELISCLAEVEGGTGMTKVERYERLALDITVDRQVREVAAFHVLDTKSERVSRKSDIIPAFRQLNPDPVMPPDDEFVEDAGLFDLPEALQRDPQPNSQSKLQKTIIKEIIAVG